MRYPKFLAVLSILAVLSLSAFARDKSQHSVDIYDSVQIGSSQLQPGNYKVQWQGTGPEVQVTFLHNGKTVATVPGTLKTKDSPVVQDDIVTDTTSSSTKVLREIDFGHEALVFDESGM